MRGEQRKAAIAAYKERKVVAGIYAVRCSATGQCWAGAAPDLSTVETRLSALRPECTGPASRRHIASMAELPAYEIERLPEEDSYIQC